MIGRTLALLGLAATAVTATVGASAAQAAPSPVAATQDGTVTLITGDRVTTHTLPGGPTTVNVTPGPGRDHVRFMEETAPGAVAVLPLDAAKPLAQGRLDPRLFEVSYLIAHGDDDGHRASLPVTRDGTALTVAKSQAAQFWNGIETSAAKTPKIWLNASAARPADGTYDFTPTFVDRNGATAGPNTGSVGFLRNLDTGYGTYVAGGQTVHIPAGHYYVTGFINTARPGKVEPAMALMVDPNLDVTKDTTITLDSRSAKRVQVSVDQPTAAVDSWSVGMSMPITSLGARVTSLLSLGSDDIEDYAGTVAPSPNLTFGVTDQLSEPLLRLSVTGPQRFAVPVLYAYNSPQTALLGTRHLDAAYGGDGTPAALRKVSGKIVVLSLPAGEDDQIEEWVRNVKAAGGRAVVLVTSTPGYHYSPDPLALPTVYTYDPRGQQLINLVQKGAVELTTQGIASSPYTYTLVHGSKSTVPARPVYRDVTARLGAARTTYRGLPGAWTPSVTGEIVFDGTDLASGVNSYTVAPSTRTEYYSPGSADFSRQVGGAQGDYPVQTTPLRSYQAGHQVAETINAAVMGPSFTCATASRDGDQISAYIPVFSDAEPDACGVPGDQADGSNSSGYAKLYEGANLIGSSTRPAGGRFVVPGKPGSYRLEVAADYDGATWGLSTAVQASWTFASTHTAKDTPLPLMAVRYFPTLNIDNQAPAGRNFSFDVRIERPAGSPQRKVTALSIQASTDGGRTWHKVAVRADGGQWIATVHNPAKGYVSLRATAKDATGNTVTQTITRAYAVR